jgi:glycosyltransferase involved in cell wall biosynthesis
MRIAMIGTRGTPNAGGAERVVEDLSGELARRGHEVLIYSRTPVQRSRELPEGTGGRVRRLFTAGWRGKHLETPSFTATAMLDVLRRDVDVVHVHSPGPALFAGLPRMAGRAVVFTVHAPDWRREKWSLPARAVLRAGLACGMRCAHEITAVSGVLAEELRRRFDRPVEPITNPLVPRPAPPAEAVERLGLPPEGYGLFVGRAVPEKRLDLLLRCWPQAAGEMPLAIACNWEKTSYGRMCRRIAPPQARFLGHRGGTDLAALYAHAALVVQPSVLEGASMVLLEAAGYGRCILAADLPENIELLEDCMVYFKRDLEADLTEKIRRCIRREQPVRGIGALAQQKVLKCQGLATIIPRYETIYTRAIRSWKH